MAILELATELDDKSRFKHCQDILYKRYLKFKIEEDGTKRIIEDPRQMFERVAQYLSDNEVEFVNFFNTMYNLDALPNSPTLWGAGMPKTLLSACAVLEIEDDMNDIMKQLTNGVELQALGSGVGFYFGNIRSRNTLVSTSGGKALGIIAVLDIYNNTFDKISQGGRRRGAFMGILPVWHDEIFEFMMAKDDPSIFELFNLSVGFTDGFFEILEEDMEFQLFTPIKGQPKPTRKVKASKIWEVFKRQSHKNGEPSAIFLDTIQKRYPNVNATNPCITGDTKIAVADGRNSVTVKQLSKENKEFPVFCSNGDKEICIRMATARKTRENVQIWELKLDDGSILRLTKDHKVMLRDGTYTEASKLKSGMSLMPFNKWITPKGYKMMSTNRRYNIAEHRLIMEYILGRSLTEEEIVHHRDWDSTNNLWVNLELMKAKGHNSLHRINILGDNNPMRGKWWDKLTEEEKNRHKQKMSALVSGKNNPMFGKKHTIESNRKNSEKIKELWQDPEYRNSVISNKPKSNPKLSETRKSLIQNSPEFREDNLKKLEKGRKVLKDQYNKKLTTKKCLNCSKDFTVSTGNAEDMKKKFCNKDCYWEYKRRNQITKICQYCGESFTVKNSRSNAKYCSVGCRAKNQGNSNITGVKVENHKVVSIKSTNVYEDVYNLSVGDFHNFAVVTSFNGTKWSGIIIRNCSEALLEHMEFCNLGSINLMNHLKINGREEPDMDWEKLRVTVKTMVIMLNKVINKNYYPEGKEYQRIVNKNRKIGLGIMGFADILIYHYKIKYSSQKARELARRIVRFIREQARRYSERYHFKNQALTSIAPTGSISTIAGVSSGIEPILFKNATRETIEGYLIKMERNLDMDWVETAHGISPTNHLRMVAAIAKDVDMGTSKTINFKKDVTQDDIGNMYKEAWKSGITGITCYRDGSRGGQPIVKCSDDNCSL